MWVKVDDGFPEHRKVFAAAVPLGRHGYARVLAVWLQGMCYANRLLTDGYLPGPVVQRFHDAKPPEVADALVDAGLWTTVPGGYQIHDYHDYNPSAEETRRYRQRKADAGRLGGVLSAQARAQARAAAEAQALAQANGQHVLKQSSSSRARSRSRPDPGS